MNKTGKNHFAAIIIAAITMGFAGGNALAGGFLDAEFKDATFNNGSLIINNPYWPLNPDGATRTFTYEAETEDGCVINKVYINGGPHYFSGVKTVTVDSTDYDALEVEDIDGAKFVLSLGGIIDRVDLQI